MKKFFTVLGAVAILSACTYKPVGDTAISGKLTVIDEHGKDITESCRKVIRPGGAFAQNAGVGKNFLEQITCIDHDEVYRIDGSLFSVNVSKKNTVVQFGSVTISLNGDGSFKTSGGNGKLEVADTTSGWSKHNIGDVY